MRILKRNGSYEEHKLEKYQAYVAKMCADFDGVSPSMIELYAQPAFYDGMSTKELDKITLRAMIDLIDEQEHPDIGNVNYQYVAGRHRLTMLRKEVFGQYEVPRLYDIVKKNVELKLYTPELLEWYTEEEWDKIESFVDHSKDEDYTDSALSYLIDKYLVQDRAAKKVYESPQIRYIVAAATAFHSEKQNRLQWIKDAYQEVSDYMFTLATPVIGGLGTPTKQFSSCVLIKAGDDLQSIYAAGTIAGKYAARRAGIGFDLGRMRPVNAAIRGGEVAHTGIIPFIKKWLGDISATSQGGIRKGSITFYMPIWHAQIEDFLVLKNNRGTEETRARHADFGVVITSLLWRKLLAGEDFALFDPNKVQDLYEAYYRDPSGEFERLYHLYENDKTKYSKKIPAIELVKLFISERSDTGRIYPVFIDNVSNQGPFDTKINPIYQSNLCVAPDTIVKVVIDGVYSDITIKELTNKFNGGKKIKVLSKDLETNVISYKQVSAAAMTGLNNHLIKITDSSTGNFIRVTSNHKVFTNNRGWVEARYLTCNDELDNIFSNQTNGNLIISEDIYSDVYDITVEDNHNFYANGILVHNCAEIVLPTVEFTSEEDPNGEIALCTLGCINWGVHRRPEDLKKSCRILLRWLHNILQYQDYVTMHSKRSTENFEPIGVGVTNLAYWMAKRKFKYGEKNALQEVKTWIEHQTYYLIEESVNIAKEKGKCKKFDDTYYAKGIFPWERRANGVNELADFTPSPNLNWEGLRADVKTWGMRNATLQACPPVETSSVPANSTNGFNLVKNLITVKETQTNNIIQVVPEYKKLKKYYQLLWDQKDCIDYIKTAAVIQAYVDQAMSTDTFYDGSNFRTDDPNTDGKIPIELVLGNMMKAHYWGLKTFYYDLRNKEASKKMANEDSKKPVVHEATIEEDCESCKV